MRLTNLIVLLVCLCLVHAGPVVADKAVELSDKPWRVSDMPGIAGGVDVDETEPNNDCILANAYTHGDTYHGELLPADTDWVTFTCEMGFELILATDEDPGLTTVDTFLELYADDCATLIASNDDGGPGLYSLIKITAPYTGTYNLLIRGFAVTSTGNYVLLGSCAPPPPPPPNNTCDVATRIPRCMPYSDTGNNATATNDYALTGSGCTGFTTAGRDVVYVVDLGAGDEIVVDYTQHDVDGSVYLISDCDDPQNSCVEGADDTLSGDTESFTWTSTSTGTYYLICDVWTTNSGGSYSLDVMITCPPTPAEIASWGGVKAIFDAR